MYPNLIYIADFKKTLMTVIIIISTLLGLIFAPLGCLVLWKRYVYYSEGLAHASMLGAVFSILSGIPIFYAAIINTFIFALIVFPKLLHE